MQEDNSFAMEKKPLPRQQVTERKTDFSAKNNGRKKWKDNSNPNGRTVEPNPTASKPSQKWNKGNNDKRPRQRGYYGNRQREEVVESEDALDVFSTSSRKGNANELLRFHFSPRENESRSHGRWPSGGGGNYRRPRKTVCYNKEQFLQASCQFVVRDGGEYSAQAIDPDALVRWDMVELVRTFSTESVTCPICLNVPFAGKITKCGHIYCWACMIRYLTLGEKNYRKCPICYDSVTTEDLRSVQWIEVPDFKIGDKIDMKLMRKSKGSVYVCPKYQWRERNGIPHNFQDGNNTKFSKLLVADQSQIQREVIDLEDTALSVQYEAAEEMEKPFISMAQELLKIRKELLQAVSESLPVQHKTSDSVQDDGSEEGEVGATPDESTVSLDEAIGCEATVRTDASSPVLDIKTNNRQRMDSESSLPFGSPVNPFPLDNQPVSQSSSPEEVHDNLELPHDTQPQKKRQQMAAPKNIYYFYQAATGQHIYLHSLNARCLQQEYGSLENCPETIAASIVGIKRMFMTEDVRKRLRYLSHIPLTCEFHVVELNLKPLLSKETLNMFRGEIENLKKERQREKREDKIRARQNELDHRKAHGLYPDMNFSLDSTQQFPLQLSATSPESSPASYTDVHTEHEPDCEQFAMEVTSEDSDRTSSPDVATSYGAWGTAASSGMQASPWDSKSFAKIAGTGSAVGGPAVQRWRSLPESHSMPVVTGPAVGSDGEEELAAPSYGDAMAAAFSCLDIGSLQATPSEKDGQDGPVAKATTGKKKKKKEKQLLFSTSMARKN